MKKNKHNANGLAQGYWEFHYNNNKLHSKGHYINGELVGYWEYYNFEGDISKIYYYIR
jgi:hypothetical protein